jgi:mono/diheme cytochrome c family protein
MRGRTSRPSGVLQDQHPLTGRRFSCFRGCSPTTLFEFALVAAFVFLSISATLAGTGQDQEKRSVWSGVYSSEQAKRGEEPYAQSCAACHGATLEGGEMAPPLVGSQFNSNWNGLTLGDLMERMRISMPQNNPGSLSRQQYADILAFMLAAGKFPTGNAELPRETEILKLMTFEASKP